MIHLIGVIRGRHILRPNAEAGAGAGDGAGGFGAGLFGVGAGAGAGGAGAVPTGAGLGAGGAGGVNAPLNNDRPTTPPQQVFPLNNGNYFAIETPSRQEAIQQPQVAVQQPQVAVQQPQVAVQQTAANQVHLVNGIDTPPPSPNRWIKR